MNAPADRRRSLARQTLIYFGLRDRELDPRIAASSEAALAAHFSSTSRECGFGCAALAVVIHWVLPSRLGWSLAGGALLVVACLCWVAAFVLLVRAQRVAGVETEARRVFRQSFATETAAAVVLLVVAVVLLVS